MFKNLSIRKKILISMLAFTLIPIFVVEGVAIINTYSTMRNQLVYDHRMSSGWLQNRLSLDNSELTDCFYEFEVDKNVKTDILNWCSKNRELEYDARWRIITTMNTVISMNSNINSIELFNLSDDTVLIAERSGANLVQTGERLSLWNKRNIDLQTNIVFIRDGREIVAWHQIHRFDDNMPIALISIHMRPYHLQRILDDIKTVPEETIIVFNDQNELIEADYGSEWQTSFEDADSIRNEMQNSGNIDLYRDGQFWFYREVNNGKLQILSGVPNKTIINALVPTSLSGILVAVLAVVSSIICSVVYSSAVSRPIIDLSSKMKNITVSDFSEKLAENRRDEIGVLQDSFDKMIERNRELIDQKYKSEIEKRNAQLNALQTQINPHFMYNTLQVIGGMALDNQVPQVYDMTLALSDIMRYSLNSAKETVTLEEEIKYLNSYLMIQNERFGGRIQTEINIAEETKSVQIPKLILQPIVENCIEHGLSEKQGPWVIQITGKTENEDLIIEIKDNGVGISEEKLREISSMLQSDTETMLDSGKHIGIINVNARIRLSCHENQYGVTIKSNSGNGTSVFIRMKNRTTEEL